MMSTLEHARDALAGIAGVVSCKVGIEKNLSPSDYPMIRVVPSRVTPGAPYSGRTVETLIYFGSQITDAEGLEDVYTALSDIEADILAVLKTIQGRYLETITDEDRLDAYKLMTVRCELASPDTPFTKCIIQTPSVVETLSGTPTVIAPFATTLQNSSASDWVVTLANGTIQRLLNGATSTTTVLTLTGYIAGAAADEASVGAYVGGVLIGNRTQVITAGVAAPVAFTVAATHTALAAATFDVRATGTAGSFTFTDMRLVAQRA
jgi:hypothetical protein